MDYRYVLKELRHHHHRTLVNVVGIAVGIALFVSINAVSSAYQKAVSLPFKNLVKGSSPLLTFFLIMVANLQLSWDRKFTLKLDNLAESIVNS